MPLASATISGASSRSLHRPAAWPYHASEARRGEPERDAQAARQPMTVAARIDQPRCPDWPLRRFESHDASVLPQQVQGVARLMHDRTGLGGRLQQDGVEYLPGRLEPQPGAIA